MPNKSFFIACLAFLMAVTSTSASVFLPYDVKRSSLVGSKIPGYGVTEQIFVGGFMNFLSIYNIVITARVLLSWFPQAQGIGVLQPVYQITDPYLNLFRGIIPPVFGLDLSPLLAFFLLNVLTNVTAAVGAEITPEQRAKFNKKYSPFAKKSVNTISFVH
eukprot:CAMPEP_0170338344 /NCGR_PEP_ID=MMETSP0116_2-20130129/70219_1 /TAXON_ID=400756 /ORGANISM="Durinskia baltica, Strain CSIRO CS-38" /LENGTH=159 /DNA_ID=CAMNT_0010591741 /DNA_START=41 /DNA_END=521 /DNA_ORIENTATION=+